MQLLPNIEVGINNLSISSVDYLWKYSILSPSSCLFPRYKKRFSFSSSTNEEQKIVFDGQMPIVWFFSDLLWKNFFLYLLSFLSHQRFLIIFHAIEQNLSNINYPLSPLKKTKSTGFTCIKLSINLNSKKRRDLKLRDYLVS